MCDLDLALANVFVLALTLVLAQALRDEGVNVRSHSRGVPERYVVVPEAGV